MRQMARAAVLLAALLAAAPAMARPGDDLDRSPGTLAAEGLEKLFQALDLFIQSIPQYEPPVVTEEGDIIIRRKREPEPESAPDPVPRHGDGITI